MLAFAAAGLAVSLAAADPAAPPRIHDWLIRNQIPSTPIVPTPHPGHDYPANSPVYTTLYANLVAQGLPVGIMLQEGTAPLTGWEDPFALDTTIAVAPQLDYVFADFETGAAILNIYEMVFRIRFNRNPSVWWTWIGAYSHYPGAYDESAFSPFQAPRGFESTFYLNSGLDVAMPNTYPYAGFQAHVNPSLWGDNLAPNLRSALFWAPIARFSLAKSNLPPMHRVIPWIAPFVDDMQFDPIDPPPIEDAGPLLQHMRLRGADGYYVLQSFQEEYPSEQYRSDMLAAWGALEVAFDGAEPPEILNLTTDKQGGLQWSGVKHGDLYVVLVSNLGNADANFTLPGGPWPNGSNVVVPMGTHTLFHSGAEADVDGDGVPDSRDGCPSDPLKTAPGACGCGVVDADADGDGSLDCNDDCPSDPLKTAPGSCGCGVADTDADGDGSADCDDGCPSDPLKTAPGSCGCGVADTDADGDGSADCDDGCPSDPSKTAPGTCGCGVVDADSDGDGSADCNDGCPSDPLKTAPGACGCGVVDADADGDGSLDCNDDCPSDPFKTAPGTCGCGVVDTDADGDGSLDCDDDCPSDPLKTAPGACGCGVVDADSDGDGSADCNDGCPSDPLKTAPGTCGCGVVDTDADGDGSADCNDGCPSDPSKTAPGSCGCGVADTDADGDGSADCDDGCPSDPLKTAPGSCGCGVADTDADGDGSADCDDGCPSDPSKTAPGTCGCGVADTDADGDGSADCDDGCPSDPLKTAPGSCGCGVADTDADGDGTPDCLEGFLQPCEVLALLASDEGEDVGFGVAVDVDGDVLIVGAPRDDDESADNGAAHIFRRQVDGAWIEEATLAAPEGSSGDGFGVSVAIQGDVAVVGADRADATGIDSGAAHVFARQAGTWILRQTLEAPGIDSNDRFGSSIGLAGDTLVIGTIDDEVLGHEGGTASVFARNAGGDWIYQATLSADDPTQDQQFGAALVAENDTVLVGAPQDAGRGGVDAGAAYVFTRHDGTWTQQAKLAPPPEANGSPWHFGSSVALSGALALVGAPDQDDSTGAVHAFVRVGDTWTPEAVLAGASGEPADQFGHRVVLAGSVAFVTAPGEPGLVHQFVRSGAVWTETSTTTPSSLSRGGARFGTAIAFDGATLVVGASDVGAEGVASGAAWVYGVGPDCNGNGIPDGCDIFDGTSADTNANGVPDECRIIDTDGDGVPDDVDGCPENPARIVPGPCGCAVVEVDADEDGVPDCVDACPGFSDLLDQDGDGIPDGCDTPPCAGDVDGNGVVDGADLGQLLGAWGACLGCEADLTDDGVVNGADLGLVLGAWGICPR